MDTLPVIDMSALFEIGSMNEDTNAVGSAVSKLREACVDAGFFYLKGHGISEEHIRDLESHSRIFFAQPMEEKMKIAMDLGGAAWRGYFPPGDELTSGVPDNKEGLYFGDEELNVAKQAPLVGSNQFPAIPAELRGSVLSWMDSMRRVGFALLRGISLALGLGMDDLANIIAPEQKPLSLFRIFNYPHRELPGHEGDDRVYHVGEHTDYGLLTLLLQDSSGGLQVRLPDGRWIDAPPIPGTLVVNLGDMLDRMTGGLFRSTPHRVRHSAPHDRLSFPFFFDPSLSSTPEPLRISPSIRELLARERPNAVQRWDGVDPALFKGTYGTYLRSKIEKVFPALYSKVQRT